MFFIESEFVTFKQIISSIEYERSIHPILGGALIIIRTIWQISPRSISF